MNIVRYTTEQEARNAATQKLQELLVQHKDASVVLMLSGGSALSLLDGIVLTDVSSDLIITMLDERFSTDPTINNFAQLTQTNFYARAKEHGTHFIDTRSAKGEDIDVFATRLNTTLTTVFASRKDLVVIATMGIGTDGHTAGIMPAGKDAEDGEEFHETFSDTKKCFVGYDAGTKNQFPLRVTVTNAFMKDKVDHAVVYAIGEEKKDALAMLQSDTGVLDVTPARIMREMRDVVVFSNVIET